MGQARYHHHVHAGTKPHTGFTTLVHGMGDSDRPFSATATLDTDSLEIRHLDIPTNDSQ